MSLSSPALAERVHGIEPFHTMELVKRAHALEAQGRSIIHMSIGEPDFTAAPEVTAALREAVSQERTGYTAAAGIPALRHAIADFYQTRHGIALDPARVIVTAGASAGLLLAMAAFIAPGEEVLLPDPSYPCNRHFVRAFDGIPRLVPAGAATRFQLSAADIERYWGPATKAALIATPANPTGTTVAPEELMRLQAAVRARGGLTIVDEIYLELNYAGEPRSVLSLPGGDGPDVIVVNSFSKYFNMTGWRLGWLIVPAGLTPVFEKLAQNLFICPSALAQHAALACFTPSAMARFEARRAEFQRRRDLLLPGLRALGFEIPVDPDGAFYIYADCSRFTNDSARFAEALLEEAGVGIVPGKDFGRHDPDRWVRFSYATSMDNIHEALRRLDVFVRSRGGLAA